MTELVDRGLPLNAAKYAPAGYRMAVASQICKEQGKTSRYEAIGLAFGLVGATSMELSCHLGYISYYPLARQFLSDILELAKAEERGYVFEYHEPMGGVEDNCLGSAEDYEDYDENGEYHNKETEELKNQMLTYTHFPNYNSSFHSLNSI